jgi:hypothetical protein
MYFASKEALFNTIARKERYIMFHLKLCQVTNKKDAALGKGLLIFTFYGDQNKSCIFRKKNTILKAIYSA